MQSKLVALLPLQCSELRCLAHYQECACGVWLEIFKNVIIIQISVPHQNLQFALSFTWKATVSLEGDWFSGTVFYGTWSFHVHNDLPLNPYAPRSEKKISTEVRSSERELEYQVQSLADPANMPLVLLNIHIQRYSPFLYRFDNPWWTMWVVYNISLHDVYIWWMNKAVEGSSCDHLSALPQHLPREAVKTHEKRHDYLLGKSKT